MIDEITGEPPAVTPRTSTTVSGLEARATGSLAGLVGQPLRRYRPGFATGAPLNLTLSGPGFLPLTLNQNLGAEPGYPDAFTPIDLGSVALHRSPVTIGGRTISRTGVVRTGATVSLSGVWLTLADLANPPTAPNLVTLASPLYVDRSAATTIATQPMTAAPPAQAKTLLRPGNVGDTSATLSDAVGLAVGTIVAFELQDPGRAEYLAVTAITHMGAGPTFPAVITLAFPLASPHAQGAPAIRMIPSAAGVANGLSAPSRAGDVSLLLSAMAGLSSATTVVVAGGGGAPEYHLASPIAGTSDVQGYVTLPPVHRAAQLRLRVHHPAESVDLQRDVMPPLGVDTLTIDFVFP
jgi:hypothetical protein